LRLNSVAILAQAVPASATSIDCLRRFCAGLQTVCAASVLEQAARLRAVGLRPCLATVDELMFAQLELQAPATATEHEAPQTATEQAPKKLPRLCSPGRRFPRVVVPPRPLLQQQLTFKGEPGVTSEQIAGELQAPPTATEQAANDVPATSDPPHKQLQRAEQRLFRATAAFERAKDAIERVRAKDAVEDAQNERQRALAVLSRHAFASLRDKATAAPAR